MFNRIGQVDLVSVEFPLKPGPYEDMPEGYGADVVVPTQKDLRQVLQREQELRDFMAHVKVCRLRTKGTFRMNGAIQRERIDDCMAMTLPWHVDLLISDDKPCEPHTTAQQPEAWGEALDIWWQNARRVGRKAPSIHAPSSIIGDELWNMLYFSEQKAREMGLVNIEIEEQIRMTMRQFFQAALPNGFGHTEMVMAYRDAHFRVRNIDIRVTPMLAKMINHVTAQAWEHVLETNWALPENARGVAVVTWNGGKSTQVRDVVHTRKGTMKTPAVWRRVIAA